MVDVDVLLFGTVSTLSNFIFQPENGGKWLHKAR